LIAPIFIADSISLAVSREKDGKLRLVYAGRDDVKVVLLGTSPLAEADSGPFMTSGPAPLDHLWRPPLDPGFAKLAQGVVGVRTPVALGWRSLAEADGGPIHDRWA
jgi:hypothetical protein